MMGQTPELVPADRLMYSLRDFTATVESFPLIVASIMSKKCREPRWSRIRHQDRDGCFHEHPRKGPRDGHRSSSVSKTQGIDAAALISRMDEPLGRRIGHHLEVEECADFLSGLERESRLTDVTLALPAG